MVPLAQIALSFDLTITTIDLISNVIQALVLPITLYLLVIQTRAMQTQTVALVQQTKEMTAQTRIFIDTIYNSAFQGLYDAEAHLSELMMAYPDASHILMSPVENPESGQPSGDTFHMLPSTDPVLSERVRWLGTTMLDFFEHIWIQVEHKGLPPEMWEVWEDYLCKLLRETHLRLLWQTERGYYDPGFRRLVDMHIGQPHVPLEKPTIPGTQMSFVRSKDTFHGVRNKMEASWQHKKKRDLS